MKHQKVKEFKSKGKISLSKVEPLSKYKNIFCIGIGGAGVSGLALLLKEMGHIVNGSDPSGNLSLENKGITVHSQHSASNIKKADLVIYSQAIPENNPERKEAKRKRIPQISYPEAIGILTKTKKTIAICGTHGKTTTTALTAASFINTDQDPTIIVGSPLHELNGTNMRSGNGKYFIVEACEYRRAFLHYHPSMIIITNIDPDHFDYYKSEKDYLHAFQEFIENLARGGTLIANNDDRNIKKIFTKKYQAKLNENQQKIVWFGTTSKADYLLKKEGIWHQGKKIATLRLKIPGEHNRQNALAVVAAAHQEKLNIKKVLKAINQYKGAKRRFEIKGKIGKAIVIDDYGHHPTEIKATLKAARERFGKKKKILCVFQPHQYSRTYHLLKEFGKAFKDANKVIIPNIFEARDSKKDKESISAEQLVQRIEKNKTSATYGEGLEKTAEKIKAITKNYDVIIAMGAGDVSKIFDIMKQKSL